MHQHNALRFGLYRPRENNRLAVDADFSARRTLIACKQLHQRRFPGSILADDRMDFAAENAQIDIFQNLNRTE